MKAWTVVVVIVLVIAPIVWAENDHEALLYDFLEGSYEIIGRWPDTDEPYTGKMELKRSNDHFKTIRRINGEIIEGVGKIETATADNINVLRIRFIEAGCSYEGTYIIASDLDNYGRLTGYVYLKEGGTKIAGLEAMFRDHGQIRHD